MNTGVRYSTARAVHILLSCLEDEMNGFPDKMKLASRNSQVLSHVTDLAQSLNRHPRDVVLPLFSRE